LLPFLKTTHSQDQLTEKEDIQLKSPIKGADTKCGKSIKTLQGSNIPSPNFAKHQPANSIWVACMKT